MHAARPILQLFGGLMLVLLALEHLRPEGGAPLAPPALARLEPAQDCAAHGCGCPHEVVPASCCCAPAAAEASAVGAVVNGGSRLVPGAPQRPTSFVTSSECNGGKRPRSSLRASPGAVALAPLAEDPLPCAARVLEPGEPLRLCSGPAREPGTPPPRGTRRA